MGKRLIRIFHTSIEAKLPDLLNTELNLILKNGVALHGRIQSYNQSSLVLKDLVNRKHEIKRSDIDEIVLDQVSPY